MITLQLSSGPGLGLAGAEAGYGAYHLEDLKTMIEASQLNKEEETLDLVSAFFNIPLDWSGIDLNNQTDLLALTSTPIQITKEVFVIAFESFNIYKDKKIIIKGNAPAGRQIYISNYTNFTDFTNNYIASIHANESNGFTFPKMVIANSEKIVVWMKVSPFDDILSIGNIFKVWIDYETNEKIKDFIIDFKDEPYEHDQRGYVDAKLVANWKPSDFWQNRIFMYFLPQRPNLEEITDFITNPKTSNECINNILYAKKKKELNEELTENDLISLTLAFERAPVSTDSTNSELLFRQKDSYEGILYWSYFYKNEQPSAPVLTLDLQTVPGLTDYTIAISDYSYVFTTEQCDIKVEYSWDINDLPSEIFVLSLLTDLSIIETLDIVDPIEGSQEIYLKNIIAARNRQINGDTLSSAEFEWVKQSLWNIQRDHSIVQQGQIAPQQKTFNLTIACGLFYNEIVPESQDKIITLSFKSNTIVKRNNFYINHAIVQNDERGIRVSYQAGWNPEQYPSNELYKYGPIYPTDEIWVESEVFKMPETTGEAAGTLLHAYHLIQNNETDFSEEEIAIIYGAFGILTPFSVHSTFLDTEEAISGGQILVWSVFQNENLPPEERLFINIQQEPVCLTGDTLITMADGTRKRLDALRQGDLVLSDNAQITEVERIEIQPPNEFYTVYYFENDIIIKEASPHRFYNVEQGFWQKLGRWKIGEHAIHENGKHIALLSKEIVPGTEAKYGLFTKSGKYYANGLLSGFMKVNKPFLSEAKISDVINMVTSIDSNRALRFSQMGK